jgi:hypothetical protein
MKRDPSDNPDYTGDWPVIPPAPPAQHPPRQDCEGVPVTEEREPANWKGRLLEVGMALGILVALALFVWSWFRFRGGAP